MISGDYRLSLTVTEHSNFKTIPAWLRQIAQQILAQGFQVYLVGGAVRDLLWDLTPHDWDLATTATPDQIEAIFDKTIPSGKQYGTITVNQDEHYVEITTLREDLLYTDGRRPDAIRFTDDILKDLARRDFTINALAYNFADHTLIDPFKGRHDLRHRLLKSVGDPKLRFAEDGLRMFRFFRFLATYKLKADRQTLNAINPSFSKFLSMERIRDELSKMLLGKFVRVGLEGLEQTGLLRTIIPELEVKHFKIGSFNKNLWEHLLTATEAIQAELILRWSALLHDIAKPLTYHRDQAGIHFHGHERLGAEMSQTILTRLRYPNTLIESVSLLIQWHMFNISLSSTDAAVRKFIARVGKENLQNLLELRRADIIATGRISYESWEAFDALCHRLNEQAQDEPEFSQKNLAVNGHDLMNTFKLSPGPLIGQILNHLLNLVIEDPARNQKNRLLDETEKYLKNNVRS